GVLAPPPPLGLFLGMLAEPALHRPQDVLVLPWGDPPLLGGGAAVPDGTTPARVGPVAAQDQPIFFIRVMVCEPFTGGTDVNIFLGHVAEVLFAKAPFRV